MNELEKELTNRISRLGKNEMRLAYSKAENKNDVNEMASIIEAHRKPFSEGRVASIGAMTMASPETWAKIAEESEAAAKRELLQNSGELAELERLEKAASEAQRLADAKQAELSRTWEELNSIPEKVKAIGIRLAQIDNELASLDAAKLEEDFRSLYRSMLNGARTQAGALDSIAARLVTAELRKDVLTQVASELESELAGLKAREKALAKKLGGQRI